ncbi:MAG TPA: NRDE family protein, partial [Steroidobacteraceae bacterium]
MCLLVLAWQVHPGYRLVVAANRDEYHERPAAPLAKWPPPAQLIAGRDLRAQGTWLAVDRERRFGVVTNFRELQRPRAGAPSRGALIPRYLSARARFRAQQFFATLEPQA